jgi:hypothetical protein
MRVIGVEPAALLARIDEMTELRVVAFVVDSISCFAEGTLEAVSSSAHDQAACFTALS